MPRRRQTPHPKYWDEDKQQVVQESQKHPSGGIKLREFQAPITENDLAGDWYFFYWNRACVEEDQEAYYSGSIHIQCGDPNDFGLMSCVPAIKGTIRRLLRDDSELGMSLQKYSFRPVTRIVLGDSPAWNAWHIESSNYESDQREWTIWLTDACDDRGNPFLVLEWTESGRPMVMIGRKRRSHRVSQREAHRLGIGLSGKEVRIRALEGFESEEEDNEALALDREYAVSDDVHFIQWMMELQERVGSWVSQID